MNIGQTMREIRINKGYTQKYVSSNFVSQSAYSKFELNRIDILASSYMSLLEKVDVSLAEFYYIMNNYAYSRRQNFIYNFFSMPFNHRERLKETIKEANQLLLAGEDHLIDEIRLICEALLLLNKTNNIEQARELVSVVWDRLSKHDSWYLMDIRLINSILFIFPIETAINIADNALKRIYVYKEFQDTHKLEINIRINFSLLLIKSNKFNTALDVIEGTIPLCKKHGAFRETAICYGRKGICLNNLGSKSAEKYTGKAVGILRVLEEKELEIMLLDEIKNYF